jgi:hypothetical protein
VSNSHELLQLYSSCNAYCAFQTNEVKSYPQVIHQAEKNWWIILFSQMPYKCYNEGEKKWGKVGECGEVGKLPGDAGIMVLVCG